MEQELQEPFENVLVDFDPLIKSLIKRYSFHSELEDMYQIGQIALWEAYEKFDRTKGQFPAYAKRYISGRLLQMINKNSVEFIYTEDHVLEKSSSIVVPFLEEMILEEYMKTLSPREVLFVQYVILQQGKMKELANREGVSYETVRSWRKQALSKMRIKGKILNKDK